jgi:hypothetical protein
MITYTQRNYSKNLDNFISFDGRHIEAKNFFTTIPISSAEYRENNSGLYCKNEGSIEIVAKDNHTDFIIIDDWENMHILSVPNKLKSTIEAIKEKILASDIKLKP